MKKQLSIAFILAGFAAGGSPVTAADPYTNDSTSLTAFTFPEFTEYDRAMQETQLRIAREQAAAEQRASHPSDPIPSMDALPTPQQNDLQPSVPSDPALFN